jgi:hypothetical protein
MNERIRLLAEQAFFDESTSRPSTKMYTFSEHKMEKFAELIVRECVAQIRPMWNQVKEVGAPPGYDYDTFDLAYNDCMNAIKEHFGVEDRAVPILSADEQALFAGITSSKLFTIAGAKKHFGEEE